MKFTVSKKLSDNATLRIVLVWMLGALMAAMALSLASKAIEYGTTPQQWQSAVLGNEAEFVDPLTLEERLLRVHTDLFSLILVFILISSLMMRTSYSTAVKMVFLTVSLGTLILYPMMLLGASWLGSTAVFIAGGSFAVFHALMMGGAGWILTALLRSKI